MGNQPSSRIPTPTASNFPFDEKDTFTDLSDSLSALHMVVPLSSDGSLTLGHVSQWEGAASSDSKVKLARTILSQTDIRSVLTSRSARIADQHIFNHVLDFKTGPVTNQKSSGRCWLFATTNVIRYGIMRRLKLKDFQLSQSYLFFWDKLNKSNYYLELMIEHAELPIDDRLINHLSGDLISDGGQWDMVVNLIETYGLVPQSAYPESTHSSLSGPLNALLKTKLREHALILRALADNLRSSHVKEETVIATLRVKKEELMREIYNIMTATLGVPPHPKKTFVWEYIDADEKVGRWEGSPKDYFEQFAAKPFTPVDSFSLINDPRNEYSKLYTVDKLGNIWGGRPILYVNTEIENMKAVVVRMIKAGQPVFFGCDVGKFSDRDAGIMDTGLFEYENAFDIKLGLTKADRLQINDSAMTHAMVISGVHLDPAGKPVRYKVENSWGDTAGKEGYFIMTDAWFEQYVYQVVVPKALAPKDLVQVYESGDKVVLPPWDPMGALA
ncbi:peptidase C1B, bleomycin hydrolase [Crassisporium funariophilum]|nr:peptidase C1B, bleomycin hydrolase [Crassisporium funariophilum]